MGDHGASADTFGLRRARIITEGTFNRDYPLQFVPEFGGSSILDADVALKLADPLAFKVGKFKSPVGLEQLSPTRGRSSTNGRSSRTSCRIATSDFRRMT